MNPTVSPIWHAPQICGRSLSNVPGMVPGQNPCGQIPIDLYMDTIPPGPEDKIQQHEKWTKSHNNYENWSKPTIDMKSKKSHNMMTGKGNRSYSR